MAVGEFGPGRIATLVNELQGDGYANFLHGELRTEICDVLEGGLQIGDDGAQIVRGVGALVQDDGGQGNAVEDFETREEGFGLGNGVWAESASNRSWSAAAHTRMAAWWIQDFVRLFLEPPQQLSAAYQTDRSRHALN